MFTRESPSNGPNSPKVVGFYEKVTGSVQYICIDEATKKCAVIDTVLDFDTAHARTSTNSAQTALDYIETNGLTLEWILDTHPHADHLIASAWLKEQTGVQTAIGEKTRDIAKLWAKYYNLPDIFDPERDFDHLFTDGDTFKIGNLDVRVMLSPGHTLGSITYIVGDAAFVHDTFMYPDSGTSRADFPGGSSNDLWDSLQAILALPDDTRLYIGHDYPPVGDRKDPAWEATVAEHKSRNKHLSGGVTKAEFRRTRDERDATLSLPSQMMYALQVNLRGGRLLPAEEDGRHYFKIPANYF